MIFLEAVSRVPEERRTLFRTLYNTELCTHFLSDETSALPTERPLKTKTKKNLANFCSINRSFFSFGCRFYSKLETKMWLGLLKTSGSLTTISINQLNQFCQLNRRLSDEEPSENTEPLCVCVCVSFETTHNVPFFFLNDEPRPDLPNWSRNCGVVAGRDRRTEELLSTPTAPWSTWPAPDCCKRRRCSWRTGRRTGWRSTPSGWCRSASCWASRCPSSEISGTPLISGEKSYVIHSSTEL